MLYIKGHHRQLSTSENQVLKSDHVYVVMSATDIWVFPKKRGNYPQIMNFNRVFHHKPSILGYHYFWKHPYAVSTCSHLALLVLHWQTKPCGVEIWIEIRNVAMSFWGHNSRQPCFQYFQGPLKYRDFDAENRFLGSPALSIMFSS